MCPLSPGQYPAHCQGPTIRPRNGTKSPAVPPTDPFEAYEFVQRVPKKVEKHLANWRFAAADDQLGICRTDRQILCVRKPTTARAKTPSAAWSRVGNRAEEQPPAVYPCRVCQ